MAFKQDRETFYLFTVQSEVTDYNVDESRQWILNGKEKKIKDFTTLQLIIVEELKKDGVLKEDQQIEIRSNMTENNLKPVKDDAQFGESVYMPFIMEKFASQAKASQAKHMKIIVVLQPAKEEVKEEVKEPNIEPPILDQKPPSNTMSQ